MSGRFYYDYEDPNGAKIMDLKEGKNYPLETIGDYGEIIKIMNELHEENEQLKKQL